MFREPEARWLGRTSLYDGEENFSFLNFFPELRFKHVCREGIKVAEFCARFAMDGDFLWSSIKLALHLKLVDSSYLSIANPMIQLTPPLQSGSFCERIRISGTSRFNFKSYATSLFVTVKASDEISQRLYGNIGICFHRNASLGTCQCGNDEWKSLQKGEWKSAMSPYDTRFIDVKSGENVYGSIMFYVEEEFHQWRLICLGVGFLLLLMAPIVSKWVPFYYSSSMALGVLLVVLLILFQGMKLLPMGRKNIFYLTLYGSVLGIGSYIAHYFSTIVNSILVNFGLSEEMHNPVSVFLLVGIALAGAGLGYWIVRKFVLSEDGQIDAGVAQFVKWAMRIVAVVLILQYRPASQLWLCFLAFAGICERLGYPTKGGLLQVMKSMEDAEGTIKLHSSLDALLAVVALGACWSLSFLVTSIEWRSRHLNNASLWQQKGWQASSGSNRSAEFLNRSTNKGSGQTLWGNPSYHRGLSNSPSKGKSSEYTPEVEPHSSYYTLYIGQSSLNLPGHMTILDSAAALALLVLAYLDVAAPIGFRSCLDDVAAGQMSSTPNRNLTPGARNRRLNEDFYSTFHKTPTRKFSKMEWEDFTRESTREALSDWASSPEVAKWITDNAHRLRLSQDGGSDTMESSSGSSEETALDDLNRPSLFKWSFALAG
ncbi:hypothetical protein KSP40_PGU019961 [Platanthera guangdongensis]|uniref:Uncharacterized protein n=1 Tax=Platanthera guangdongensis TaxID=2320717 RepID=A0ABR2LWE9_9ASPA